MPLNLITPPTEEPVSVVEARLHLREVDTSQDYLIKGLIAAARRYAEQKTNRSLCTQTWELVLDSFPGPSLMGVPYGVSYSIPGHAIVLERGPVQTVTSITYVAMDGTTQTMPSSDYVVSLSDDTTRITPGYGKIWPVTLPQIGSVKVRYDAGYGGPDAVPESVKAWIRIRLATLYENREEVAILNRGKIEPLPYIDRLLDDISVPLY